MSSRQVVLDASAFIEVLRGGRHAGWVGRQLARADLAEPAHFQAEVLSAVGRHHRAGTVSAQAVEDSLRRATLLRAEVHPLGGLLLGAWARRDNLRLADALYVELAAQLDTVVVTTDRRLARATSLAVAPPEQ
ncbi:MAG: ribonuclease [Marmoricola sp.]|nr:ribonuclease [Marmoricola sp.]